MDDPGDRRQADLFRDDDTLGWFAVDVVSEHGHPWLRLRGELDLQTAPRLSAALIPLSERVDVIGLDLAELEFMDVAGLNVLFAAKRRLGGRRRLVIRSPSPLVCRIMAITGLADLVEIVEIVE